MQYLKREKDDDYTPPKRGRGTDKECVIGMIERGGKVKTKHHSKKEGNRLDFKSLHNILFKNISPESTTLDDKYNKVLQNFRENIFVVKNLIKESI
jgi:hypothetical protein